MKKLEFTKSWLNKNDFPTYEESEEQVRRDMQSLHDEARDALNALIDALSAPTAASELGAVAPDGLSGRTVQALIGELAAAIGALGGAVELDGSTLARLVAESMETDVLGDYYTGTLVEEKLKALGLDALTARVTDMENAFSREGVVMGEVAQPYPFTMPGAELAGLSGIMSTQWTNRIFLGNTLSTVVAGTESMLLKRVNVLTREEFSTPLSGQAMPISANSQNFVPLWVDDAGEYMIAKAGYVWYLLSLKTGVCSQLASGSEYTYCGTARLGNIVTAVFYYNNNIYFYRRNIAGDNGSAPAITALDNYYESGSARDKVLGTYGSSLFFMLKYNTGDSKLKAYAPAEMSCSAEFSTGLAGVYACGGICRRGTDCYFLLATSSGTYYHARCGVSLNGSAAKPSLVVGESAVYGSRVIARGDGVVYAVSGSNLYVLDAETVLMLSSAVLPGTPSSYLCSMNGAELGELWGGRYIPAGSDLVDVSDMSRRALRCDGISVEGYAVHTTAGRYFVAYAGGKWYLFDSLLRPVWGMVPYVTAETQEKPVLPQPDTSNYGTLTKA
ncbi:MAG: hypothetical protein PUB32_04590 [Clostridiales bacterium]|nr:hypothetical protein [Clostridiales bacterium]